MTEQVFFVAMQLCPWADLEPRGNTVSYPASFDAACGTKGFLPVFTTLEELRQHYPNAKVQEACFVMPIVETAP
jgi:hypothetical protein